MSWAVFYLLWILSLLIHELGHALPYVHSSRSIGIRVGTAGPGFGKRLRVQVFPLAPFNGFCNVSDYLTAPHRLLSTILGPLFNALLVVVLILAINFAPSSTPGWLLQGMEFTGVANVALFLVNILPFRLPWPTRTGIEWVILDGLRALRELRHLHSTRSSEPLTR